MKNDGDAFQGMTMGLHPTKGDEDALDVAHALVRAVFALLRTQSCENERRSHECERGRQKCVRHGDAFQGMTMGPRPTKANEDGRLRDGEKTKKGTDSLTVAARVTLSEHGTWFPNRDREGVGAVGSTSSEGAYEQANRARVVVALPSGRGSESLRAVKHRVEA